MPTPSPRLRFALIVLLLALLPILPPAAAPPAHAQEPAAGDGLPPGFIFETFVSGLAYPVDLAFLPDSDDILVAQKGGYSDANVGEAAIRLVRNGVLQPQPVVTLNAAINADSGVFALVLDPDFASNHWFYVWYAPGPNAPSPPGKQQFNRLIRLTYDPATGSADPASYRIVLDKAPWSGLHNGGGLRFGTDGMLYLTVGDANEKERVQDLDTLNGKLLRIQPGADGGYSVPPDNPFVGVAGALPEIYALGFRNPFRLAVHSTTGAIVVGDVGDTTWEEINLIEKGANYGWPLREGPCPKGQELPCAGPPPHLTDPYAAYPHGPGRLDGGAVAGLAYYEGSAYPDPYPGQLFLVDYNKRVMGYVAPERDPEQRVVWIADAIGRIVGLSYHKGDLYTLDIISGKIMRMHNTGSSNRAPVAVLEGGPTVGAAPLTVTFSGAASSDPDGPKLRYRWNFGDDSQLRETETPFIKHKYEADGAYMAELTVVDDRGARSTPAQLPITVYSGEMPAIELALLGAPGRTRYHGGDTVQFKALRSTLDGLDAARPWRWDIGLYHNQHVHPELTGFTAAQGTYAIPTESHGGDTGIWYAFVLTMRTAQGLEVTVEQELHPALADVSVAMQPALPGLLEVDGVTRALPLTFEGIVGTVYTLEARPALVLPSGIYAFDHWQSPILPGGESAQATLPVTVTVAAQTHTLHYAFDRAAEHAFLPIAGE